MSVHLVRPHPDPRVLWTLATYDTGFVTVAAPPARCLAPGSVEARN